VERLDIKKLIYEKLEQFRKPGTLVTSNTSGIPIHLMTEGRLMILKSISAGHIFLIHRDTSACWRSSQRQIPIRKWLTSSCITAMFI
jgi:hypothetical protein